MKLVRENITLKESKRSFQCFKVEEDQLRPYWHYHPELELTLIYEGSGTRFVGDSILPYQPFDLVLVGENLPHHWVSLNSLDNNLQKAVVIQFPKNLFDHFPECDRLQDLYKIAEKGIQFIEPDQQVLDLLLKFDELSEYEQLNTLMKVLYLLNTHENRAILSQASYTNHLINTKNQTKIAKTTSYILEHLDEKISINDMAELTHLVPQSFCRWFKNATGNTFVNYLNKARIERACQLLLNTKEPISDICFNVGFESLSHFNRTFLKRKGMSPRSFRNQH